MIPWMMALAGTLAAKMKSGEERRRLAAQIQARNAQRLGGNTDMLDAITGRQAIDASEGQAIGKALSGSLVGQLGQGATAAPGPGVAAQEAAQEAAVAAARQPYKQQLMAGEPAGYGPVDPRTRRYGNLFDDDDQWGVA